MRLAIIFLLLTLISPLVFSGSITIEKNSTLIRNDIFDEKVASAQTYKLQEQQRKSDAEAWSSQIDPSCGLIKNSYLLYYCATNNRYYQASETESGKVYRELANTEREKITDKND